MVLREINGKADSWINAVSESGDAAQECRALIVLGERQAEPNDRFGSVPAACERQSRGQRLRLEGAAGT